MREKSEKTDEELETKIGAVMCVHVDANRTLSQLSYRPIHCFSRRKPAYDIIAGFFKK